MKKTVLNTLALATLFFASAANAQVGVGVPAGDIHPSAELEVKSTTKGFLPPRMTNAERNSIAAPATGLLIYQTDAVANNPAGLYFYDGTAWKNGLGVVGATGATGPAGLKGDRGETGLTGAAGAIGPKGDRGETGLTGTAGAIGPKGDRGETGPAGANGATGPAGTAGINGTTGATGPVGPAGPKGDAGNGFNNGTAKNQIMYWNGSAWVTLNPGSDDQFLKISNGNLIWSFIEGYGKPITDIDGNVYRTVNIGNQQWMAENLKVSKYNDGTDIPNIIDAAEWSSLTTGAWAYYNNNEANNDKYGKLYNWYAVSPDKKNVCPTGWHVPTDTEWTVLTEYLGGGTVAGGRMKEVGITSWISPNTDATNSSLFTGLPGGIRGDNGSCYVFGINGYWWSSSEYEGYTNNAWNRGLSKEIGTVYTNSFGKKEGLSVRCLKD